MELKQIYQTIHLPDPQKIYFPNLNGLRFIAALLVIIHHIEQIKSIVGLDNYWLTVPFIKIIGRLGVILFFVLSGFLITYLLLMEEQFRNTISIKKFYIRRILRIWPLYFLIILLAFVVLPNVSVFSLPGYGKEVIYSNLFIKLILLVLFLPNLVIAAFTPIPYLSHNWSIGTEEQFYLIWPVLLKYFKNFRILLMFCVIAIYLIIRIALASHFTDLLPNKAVIAAFWSVFNIDCMAIGGIFGILLFQKSVLLKWLQNNFLFYAALLLSLAFIAKGIHITYFHEEFYALLFGIIILNFAANDNIRITLENKVLNYLGKISYGLYMYHLIAIVLALAICNVLNYTTNWVIYPLSISLTVAIASLSYEYFESYFLKLKNKFAGISIGS